MTNKPDLARILAEKAVDARDVFEGTCDTAKQAIDYYEQSILAALEAAPPMGVKVKPLKWFEAELPSRGGGKYTADGYTLRRIEGLWLLDFAGSGKTAWRWVDLEAAKAAAQADYEARIMAALEVPHHVNETPKSEHDSADMLAALPADVEALLEEAQKAQEWMRLPDHAQRLSWVDVEKWLKSRPINAIPALIALATAQAARIAGLEATIRKFQTVHSAETEADK